MFSVEVELIGGGVRAEESSKVHIVETLVSEELGERSSGGVDVGEKSVGCRCRGRGATDPGLDLGSAGASDDGVVPGKHDEIGYADRILGGESADVGRDLFKTLVFGSTTLFSIEDETAVTAAFGTLSFVPG